MFFIVSSVETSGVATYMVLLHWGNSKSVRQPSRTAEVINKKQQKNFTLYEKFPFIILLCVILSILSKVVVVIRLHINFTTNKKHW